MKRLILGGLLLALSQTGSAREPDNLEDIQREARIVKDVMQSALRQELRGNTRVTQVQAEYLPRQGVLVSVTMNTPWLHFDDKGEPTFEFHGNISIPEIPAMVTNILQDLQLNVSPYEPEALEELRDLRDEQRDLRMSSREKRSELRSQRRALVRAEDGKESEEVEREIKQLEEELALLDKQYETLSRDIEAHYQRLRQAPPPPAPQPASEAPAPMLPEELDAVFAQAVCDYGATLKSLRGDEYLTLAVRRGKQSEYLAFRMEQVNECSRNNMSAERLLNAAYRYKTD